jgi:uncharacterized membrane protein
MTRIAHVDLVLVAVVSIAAAIAAIAGLPTVVRVPIGIVAVLLLPGYSLSVALFPPGDLIPAERWALAFALSLAAIILIAAFLDTTGEGLSNPLLVTALTGTTLGATAAAWLRLHFDGGGGAARGGESAPGGATLERGRRAKAGGLPVLLAVAAVPLAALITVIAPRPPAPPAEFYLLESGGSGAGYPTSVAVGQPVRVPLGIINHAGSADSFRILARTASDAVGSVGPVDVAPGGTWSGEVSFTLSRAGSDQEVMIDLYRPSDQDPYRELRLWIDAHD